MGGTDGRGALPPTLRDARMLRIERLSRMLSSRCGCWPPPTCWIIDPRLGVRVRPRVPRVREAVAAKPVVADEERYYSFRHALLREAAADDLLPGERAPLHLALARALERRGGPAAGTAARNWRPASPITILSRRPAGALEASARAGRPPKPSHAKGEASARYPARRSCGTGWRRRGSGGRRPGGAAARRGVDNGPRARAGGPSPMRAATRGPATATRAHPAAAGVGRARTVRPGRSATAADTREGAGNAAARWAEPGVRRCSPGGAKELIPKSRTRRRSRPLDQALVVAARPATRSRSCARSTRRGSRCSASRVTRRASGRCARRCAPAEQGGPLTCCTRT